MPQLKDFILNGGLVERRDGNFEVLVPFDDLDNATQNAAGNVKTINGELDLNGLSPDFRYDDIVRFWGLTDSSRGFFDFDNSNRELLWEGNDMPLLSEIEYNILDNLQDKFKDFYFRKADDMIYLISPNFANYLHDGDAESAWDIDEDDSHTAIALHEEILLPFADLYLTMMRNGISDFNVADLLDYNAELFAD